MTLHREEEPYQLAPGPQWFFVRVRGKAWGLAIEAMSAFDAIDLGLRQFTIEGPGLSRDGVEAIWIHPDAISTITQTSATRRSMPAKRPGKVPARKTGKRRPA